MIIRCINFIIKWDIMMIFINIKYGILIFVNYLLDYYMWFFDFENDILIVKCDIFIMICDN